MNAMLRAARNGNAGHEIRPSMHIQRTVTNMSKERLGVLALNMQRRGIKDLRFSSQRHMYATILGAGALAEYYDSQSRDLTEDTDNLRGRIREALRETGPAVLEVPSLPAKIYSVGITRHRREKYILAVGISEIVAKEITATQTAVDPNYDWPLQYSGLRIADSGNPKSIEALNRLVDRDPSFLPEYIIYQSVTTPDVSIRQWK